MSVPHPENNPNFLGDIIRQMKENINSRNAVSVSGNQLRDLNERLNAIDHLEDFQAEMKRMQQENSPTQEKKMLVNVAKDKGYVIDRAQGTFVADSQGKQNGTTQPATPEPSRTATAATATAEATQATANGQSQTVGEQQFEPPPADPINEPPPPSSDPFANPAGENDDEFDF